MNELAHSSGLADAGSALPDASALLSAFPAHIALLDNNGVILKVNDSWRRFGNEELPDIVPAGVGDAYHLPFHIDNAREEATARKAQDGITEVTEGRSTRFIMEFSCHTTRTKRWFELTARRVAGTAVVLVSHTDITARHLEQVRIMRINRLYTVAVSVNESIVYLKSEQELFEQACRIAVELGELRMAWVAVVDPASKKFKVAASWGNDMTFLRSVQLSTEAGTYGGDGPAGVAYRSGQAVSYDDIATESRAFDGRELAVALGYRSCIALPLKVAGQAVAVYVAYSDIPGFFDEEITRLMTTLANNLSFAVEARRREEKQGVDVENLKKSKALLGIASRLGRIGAWTLDLPDFQLEWSEEFARSIAFPLATHRRGKRRSPFIRRNIVRSSSRACQPARPPVRRSCRSCSSGRLQANSSGSGRRRKRRGTRAAPSFACRALSRTSRCASSVMKKTATSRTGSPARSRT